MTSIFENFESPASLIHIYSTKSAVSFYGTIASAATQSITLGPAGIYEIFVQGPATTSGEFQIRDSADTKNIAVLAVDQSSFLTRRFRTTEDSLAIKIKNNSSASADVAVFGIS